MAQSLNSVLAALGFTDCHVMKLFQNPHSDEQQHWVTDPFDSQSHIQWLTLETPSTPQTYNGVSAVLSTQFWNTSGCVNTPGYIDTSGQTRLLYLAFRCFVSPIRHDFPSNVSDIPQAAKAWSMVIRPMSHSGLPGTATGTGALSYTTSVSSVSSSLSYSTDLVGNFCVLL